MKRQIYLDNNATTPLDPQVAEAVYDDLKNHFGNPSSIHSFGQDSRSRLLQARDILAAYLHVKPAEIIFVSSGTEAMNMLIRGLLQDKPGSHIISSSVEHSSVYTTLKVLEKDNHSVTYLAPGLYGAIRPEAVREAIRGDTKLITVMAANNETGVKTDIAAIAKLAEEFKIPFIVDGIALLGKEPFSIPPGVSAMGFSGHKIHAPKGVGFVFLRSRVKLSPLLLGGDQEYSKRGGTENMPGIMGLAKAIEILSASEVEISAKIRHLRDDFEKKILSYLEDVTVNGEGSRVGNTSNLAFHGVEGESLLRILNQQGVAVSHGSACSSGALEPSRVLLNMGIPMKVARSSLRFSFSRMNTQEEVDEAVAIIIKSVQKLRNYGK